VKGRKPKARKAGDGVPALVRPVEAPAELLAPPPSLPPEGVQLWERAVAELGELIHPAHLPLLEQLIIAHIRHRQAQEIIDREGLMVQTSAGDLKLHPAARLERDSAMLYTRLCDQLGLSPAALMRLGIMQAIGRSLTMEIAERVDAHLEASRSAKRRR